MKRSRRPKRTSKYWVEPEIFDNVVTFCRCYPIWVRELMTLPDGNRAIQYDKDRVQSSGDYDATAELAMKRIEIERKVNLVRTTAKIASPELWEWILKDVTSREIKVDDLIAQGMPASANYYAKLRKYFYYLLSKRI